MPDQPPKPPQVALRDLLRDEVAALAALLRAHTQAQLDLGLDACAPPPDSWVGWQREALTADDLRWEGQPPPSPKPTARALPDVAPFVQPSAPRAPRAPAALGAAAPAPASPPPASPAPASPAPTPQAPTPPLTAPSAPRPAPARPPAAPLGGGLLLGGVVFQEVIQHATQASVIDASARPSLEVIYAKARACTRCAMSRHRERAVVGCGDPNAQLLIVTGPPSAAEEALGAPLTGPEGDLLDNMLKAMTLSRERVFITPVIKCRAPDAAPDAPSPPDLPYALAACNPFLMEELKSVHAPVVLALGDVAAQHLLGKREHLSHLRGTFHLVHGVAVMPTFHPAHLLRHPEAKPLAWRDLQRVMERLGLKRPTPPT